MAIEFYGARHINMLLFGPYDKKEIMRLRREGFLYVCKDDSYNPVKAFKREPLVKFLEKDKTSCRFYIYPRTGEKMEDVMVDYRALGQETLFMKLLRYGEMFDVNIMVAFDCVHLKKEDGLKKEIEKVEKSFLKSIDNF